MKKVRKIFSYLIMFTAIIVLIVFYNKYNFNNFDKNIRLKNATNFVRDSKVKYSKSPSYKIENTNYNDAMFSQTISVKPNTPYKVTCMVKTNNVQKQNKNADGGVYICLNGSEESSKGLEGTNEWQEISLMFNSKNKTEVNVGFRLGGNENLVKGEAWFSNFKLEKGVSSSSNVWNMVCFIFPSIDVNVKVNGKEENVNLKMSDDDIYTVQTNLNRFKSSIKEISNNKIKINYDEYIISEPIKNISYDEENAYYISANDVYEYINSYVEEKEYDHIYIAFRMADKQSGNVTLTSDWIGLGGMDYYGIGFSNIRMPDDNKNLVYKFNYKVNTFPEEVFIHEFLHTLEQNAKEYNYEIPELHDYAQYGYTEDSKQGLKKWYIDYMNKTINYNGTNVGLPTEIYTCRPIHESNFKYATETLAFKEPQGVIEIIQSIIRRIEKLFQIK